ncbi:MAG: PHP domain-containing protein, partial [Bacilli bacterium]|nr:PHP domain-containing protein [Bacilli bacterium]
MSFVPLHIYTGFSYLKSALPAQKVPFLAKKYGFSKVGITDDGSLSGFAPFEKACKEAGVTPIYGMDANVEEGTFSLFVENEAGYRNLLHLTKLSSEKKLTFAHIKERSMGLALVYTMEPRLFEERYQASSDELALKIAEYTRPFAHSYIGLPYLPHDPKIVNDIRSFSATHSLEVVAFPKILYEKPEDAIALEILHA